MHGAKAHKITAFLIPTKETVTGNNIQMMNNITNRVGSITRITAIAERRMAMLHRAAVRAAIIQRILLGF